MNESIPPEEEPEDAATKSLSENWWEIIRTTPLRDAIRGDWSARLSYKQILRAAALPTIITERIVRIVRKARLWRSERNDVTRELIAHFQEGLDRGVPAALLVDQFGEVKTTARLIRRAKLRKRPIWWKTWYRVSRLVALLVAILVVVYVVQAVRFFTGRLDVTRNYLKEMNDEIGKIPIQERAWPLYVEAMKDFPKWPNAIWEAAENGPDSEDWPLLVKFIHDNQSRISAIEAASEKPNLGWFIGETVDSDDSGSRSIKNLEYYSQTASAADSLFSLPVAPVSSYLLNAFHILKMALKVAVEEKDSEAAKRYLIVFVHIADQLLKDQPYPLLINQLAGVAIFSGASRTLDELLIQSPDLFTLDQMGELAKVWSSFHACRLVRFSFEVDKIVHLDVLQHVYTSGTRGYICSDGYLFFTAAMLPGQAPIRSERFDWRGPIIMSIAVDRESAMNEINSFDQESEELLSVRPWEWTDEKERLLQSLESKCTTRVSVLRNPLLLFEGAHRQLARNAERAEQCRLTTLTALALSRFKRERGRWPNQLEELVPKYIANVPIDPNDGKQIRFKLVDNFPLVYSVGSDRFDDGGMPSMYQIRSGECPFTFFSSPANMMKIHDDIHDEYHGDWILWPPVEKKSDH